MTTLPQHHETFVLNKQHEDVIRVLSEKTTNKLLLQNQEGGQFKFTGWIKNDRFRISLKIHRPNSYIPLIVGKVEPTSAGCILFITYQLFPSTRMFLTFWSLLIVLVGVFAGYQYESFIYGGGGFTVVAVIHWIAWSNFRMQLKPSREALLQALS